MKDNVIYNQSDNQVMVKTNGDLIYIVCNKEEQQETVVKRMTTDNCILENYEVWEDEQVISKQWIDASRKPVKHSYGMYSNKFWMPHPASPILSLPKDTYFCAGFGGQYILIIPSKDMVVVRLGETYMEDDKVLENLSEIISFFRDII